MQEHRQVRCPRCGVLLEVPLAAPERAARCAQCRSPFPLPRHMPVSEATIAAWIYRNRDEEEAEPDSLAEVAEDLQRELARAEGGDTPAPANRTDRIRLVKLDRHGALFEFPAERLLDTDFRCAMPRRCLRCGTSAHLRAHVIVFTPYFSKDLSLKDEHTAGRLVAGEAEVRGLSGEALLAKLPQVPNVPRPADRPMPYWLCDMCTGAGVISGQIEVNTETDRGRCRLLMRNLAAAEQFLVAAGGKDTIDHRQLRARVEESRQSPWDALPLVVQHRIEQWYKPVRGEKLLAYIPDRDHARTEDGVAGIIVSNRRLIHHTPFCHNEEPAGDPLELKLAMGKGRGTLRIHAPNCNVKRMCLDREGVRTLRSALKATDFRVAWR